MFTNKIRKIEGEFTKKVKYSIQELKPILRAAYRGVSEDREIKEHFKFTENDPDSNLIKWEDILLYIQEFGLFYDPILPEKGEILWEMLDDVEMASMLVQSAADLSTKRPEDETKSSFLHVLWASKDPKMLELSLLMIQYGANVNDLDAYGNTPLYSAVKSEMFGIVEAILKGYENGIKHFLFEGYCNSVALALQSQNAVEFLEIFYRHCQYLDIVDYNLPVGHLAKVLELLVQYGYTTKMQLQSILLLALRKNVELAKFLISIRTDNNKKLIDIQTLLSDEYIRKNPDMIVFLIEEGANINKPINKMKNYLLHLACTDRSAKTIRLLLQLGADINVTDKFDRTPFSMCSTKCNNDKITKIMVKHFVRLLYAGEGMYENDLQIIRKSSWLLSYYKSCIEELERLSKIEVTVDITAYEFLKNSNYELSMLIKSKKIRTQIRQNLRKLSHENFPNYKVDIMQKFELILNIRRNVRAKEQELRVIFNEILPSTVICKIALYSLDVDSFERKYYASCYKRNLK